MTLISLKSIYKIYNVGGEEVRALDGVDLEIKDNFGSVVYSIPDPNFGGDESSVLRNITVGIDDNALEFFGIYPNPAKDNLFLV